MTKKREPGENDAGERSFLSFDRAYHQPGSRLTAADLELVRAAQQGNADTVMAPAGFAESLGLPADTEFAAPKLVIHEIAWTLMQEPERLARIYTLSKPRAKLVRILRVERRYSWRAVAEACYHAWRGDWDPPSNQVIGMGLCGAAARLLGEDAGGHPWN